MVPASHAAGSAAPQAAPAAQLAPALVALGRGPAGSHRLSLQLAPPELGRVEIRLDRTADGPARVVVSVQRPETLHLLQRDQAGLHRALDQAGVSVQGRSLSFQLGSGGGGNPSGGALSRPDRAAGGGDELSTAAAPPPPPAARFARAGLDITA
jgi:flagellar hook-length control protein FliK